MKRFAWASGFIVSLGIWVGCGQQPQDSDIHRDWGGWKKDRYVLVCDGTAQKNNVIDTATITRWEVRSDKSYRSIEKAKNDRDTLNQLIQRAASECASKAFGKINHLICSNEIRSQKFKGFGFAHRGYDYNKKHKILWFCDVRKKN